MKTDNSAPDFSDASLEELQRGYLSTSLAFRCLGCGMEFELGRVYPLSDAFYDAQSAVSRHIQAAHGSAFEILLGLDKEQTGLTERQAELLSLFKSGLADSQIASKLGGISPSTVRNHRAALREKARQAKLFLSLFELSEKSSSPDASMVKPHAGAPFVDQRFDITQEESEAVLSKYFPGKCLLKFPAKEKHKLPILRKMACLFEAGRSYTELEVNSIIRPVYADCATIRRYLIEYGFMERNPDCSDYRLKESGS